MHIYEKLGVKLSFQQLSKIAEHLSSKIKIANECRDQILEESSNLLATITNSCMKALNLIKKKTIILCLSFKNLPQSLFDDQIKEPESVSRISLILTSLLTNLAKFKAYMHQISWNC